MAQGVFWGVIRWRLQLAVHCGSLSLVASAWYDGWRSRRGGLEDVIGGLSWQLRLHKIRCIGVRNVLLAKASTFTRREVAIGWDGESRRR